MARSAIGPSLVTWLSGIAGLGAFLVCLPLPAQLGDSSGNTHVIRGTVTVLDERGEELEDRSNVVVFVDGLGARPLGELGTAVMSQSGQSFSPRVLPLVRGSVVEFPNDDTIFHNVFSLSRAKPFDLGIYPKGDTRSVIFDQPGLVRVYCNIHPEMISTILVLNNSFFATTDREGNFELSQVPAGQVTLRVWSEFGEEINRRIELDGEDRVEESFIVQETRRITDHDNKFGRPYSEKY